MITVLVLFCILLIISFIAAVVIGMLTVAPIWLVIIGLSLIDYFVLKLIFGKKRKD